VQPLPFLSPLIMVHPDPPPNFIPTHLVLPVGLIYTNNNCTDFMNRYMAPTASPPDTAPSLPVPLGGIPFFYSVFPVDGAFSVYLFHLRSGGCIMHPYGKCQRCAPVPENTPSVGPPCCPDPEKYLSGLHLYMGFGFRPCTLFQCQGGGGVLDLRCLCPLAAPMFHLLGILVEGSRIKKMIYWGGGACQKGLGWRPCALLLSMGGNFDSSLPSSPGCSFVPLFGCTCGGL
jgi:hypothetical protein